MRGGRGQRPRLQLSMGENAQENDFDCERFVDIATQIVA